MQTLSPKRSAAQRRTMQIDAVSRNVF